MKYTRTDELNQALYKVMITQFKKDCRDAIAIVEKAGYRIYKCDGTFHISCPRTGKYVYINDGHYTYVYHNGNGRVKAVRWDEPCAVDFVGILEKPINKVWNEVRNRRWDRPLGGTDFLEKADRLRSAKWCVKYRKADIEKKRKQIEALQNDILADLKAQARYEDDLNNVRKELGLGRR